MIIDVRLASLKASGGEVLSFPRAGVTCIVGSNNVGKSRLLREIDLALQDVNAQTVTFGELHIEKPYVDEGTAEHFLNEAGTRAQRIDGHAQEWFPPNNGPQLSAHTFVAVYGGPETPALNAAKPFFSWYASAGTLAGAAAGGIGMPGMLSGGLPLIRMYRDGDLEREISDLADATFAVKLTLDRINGNVCLRIGSPTVPVPPLDRPTKEYADAVLALPELSQQGDGIKSFLGLALTILAGTAQVLLIDEPEAFLHPAQARALGRWLGREAVARDIQVVLTTHDKDLLLGLIDSGDTAVVNIARITRDASVNHIRNLPAAEVSATWRDPVLRYSNILQGLFHERAVIAESDADCRFYRAVLDYLGVSQGQRARSDDVLFAPSGGKDRVAPMARALASLGVNTYAVVDFDALDSRSRVRDIVGALGGQWTSEMNSAYVTVADAANGGQLWGALKKQGVAGLPPGPPTTSANALLEELRAVGLLIVPVGEMEDFDRSIALDGAAWVSEMLSRGNHETCERAQQMIGALLG